MSLPVVLALCQGPSRGPTGVSSPQWRALTYALIPRCRDQSVLLVNPCLGDKLLYGATDQLLESYVAPEEERVQPVQWVTATMEEHSKGVRLVVQHSKVGGGGWGGRPVGARLAGGLLPRVVGDSLARQGAVPPMGLTRVPLPALRRP